MPGSEFTHGLGWKADQYTDSVGGKLWEMMQGIARTLAIARSYKSWGQPGGLLWEGDVLELDVSRA